MAENQSIIYVHDNWSGSKPQLLGKLYVTSGRGNHVFAFEYDSNWLQNNQAQTMLDPALAFYSGRQYASGNNSLFGIFMDSCPDRWGRVLMQRRENLLARKESRRPRALTDVDYLLGVYDDARMGALRFSLAADGPFLSNDQALSTPPWVTLRTLESASLSFENDETGLQEKWLKLLIAPGSSLGGARPKATVQAPDGSLWIAKFPSKHDESNAGAWEKVAHDLAELCGLTVPNAQLESFSKAGSTFLVKRFDRVGTQRIHFSSAMTLLGKSDGENASYLELASFIKSDGAEPEKDLKELWQRMVFNLAISNTDDHLRNHGFLLKKQGWVLSPLYDVNPIPYGNELSLNITSEDSTIDINLALDTAKYYGVSNADAKIMAKHIFSTVKESWKQIAIENGLSRSALLQMEPAFSECSKEF